MMTTCQQCGVRFKVWPYKLLEGNGKFCSRVCHGESMRMKAAKFMAQVAKRDSGCWEWTGLIMDNGYGRVGVAGRLWSAHRYAYEQLVGPIPAGLCVCHRCDNRACVNPEHLFIGTHADNMADMVRKGRQTLGSVNRGAKLTEEQVRDIRDRLHAGETRRCLAREFGVSSTAVDSIVSGKTWAWLDDHRKARQIPRVASDPWQSTPEASESPKPGRGHPRALQGKSDNQAGGAA